MMFMPDSTAAAVARVVLPATHISQQNIHDQNRCITCAGRAVQHDAEGHGESQCTVLLNVSSER